MRKRRAMETYHEVSGSQGTITTYGFGPVFLTIQLKFAVGNGENRSVSRMDWVVWLGQTIGVYKGLRNVQ
jgi:hypothetical protein